MRLSISAILCLSVHVTIVSLHPQSSSSHDKNESWNALYEAIETGSENMVKRLIENGVDVNVVDQNGLTPLELFIDKWNEKGVELLIKNGATIPENAIIDAAFRGNKKIVQILIENGANINATDSDGDSASILAAANGDISMLKLLIEKDANINAINKHNESALIQAIFREHENVANFLIEIGIDPNIGSRRNDSPLIYAISEQYNEIAELLIKKGANMNAVGDNRFTPLLRSLQIGNEKIAQILIENGANVNATNDDGDSALNLAALNTQVSIAKMLIENGADINHKGANNRTSLIAVAGQVDSQCPSNCQKYKEMLQLLIDKGANVNAVDKDGRTAADAAFEANESKDRSEVIRLLNQHGAERGALPLYRKTALKACSLYLNVTSRWNNGITSRIHGGTKAEVGEFPWMVALGYLSSEYKVSFGCGGSLISDEFVLTAAHCVKDNRRPVVVRLGKVNSTEEEASLIGENIREIIPHPKYSSFTRKNDIALIRLIDRLWLTEFIQPVCIQTILTDEDIDTDLIVAGWGQVNISSKPSSELLKADVRTMPLSDCNAFYLDYNKDRDLAPFRDGIDESQYCAYDEFERKDSCKGDSGGPLQTYLDPVNVVGVISFGIGCGSGLPGIYTRVAHYIEWIGSHVWPSGEIQIPKINNLDDY